MTPGQLDWYNRIAAAAKAAEHIFPDMAAAEAALESGYGSSALARLDNNFFGMKQHTHPIHSTAMLPTREFKNDMWVEVTGAFVKYDNLEECFEDRMETLLRLKDKYPHYAKALAATDPVTYVFQVSQSWSSDPNRAQKCVDIFNEAAAGRLAATNATVVQDATAGEH